MASAHDLSIRQLQYVVAVADTLGFHRAAERCHVSQPTLSAQIQQLEAVLGVKLFERDRRRVLLTSAGEALAARARRVLLEVDDLLAAAQSLRDPRSATLRIGVIPTVAPYLLPEVSPEVARAFPALKLIFTEEKTPDILEGLDEGRLDAGLLAVVPAMKGLAMAEVMKDPFLLAVPRGHPLAKRKRVSLEDLNDEPVLLLDDGHCLRTQALELCTRAGAREAAFRATSLATLAQMVSSGSGVTLLPTLAVPVENRRGQLEVRPIEKAPSRTLVLAYRPRKPYASILQEVATAMKKAVR